MKILKRVLFAGMAIFIVSVTGMFLHFFLMIGGVFELTDPPKVGVLATALGFGLAAMGGLPLLAIAMWKGEL